MVSHLLPAAKAGSNDVRAFQPALAPHAHTSPAPAPPVYPRACLQEMNPASPVVQKIMSNPVLYVAFNSTEPWLLEYIDLDMPGAMQAAGFAPPRQLENSPRHKTVVAVKPQ
jgi:hypothetical protein